MKKFFSLILALCLMVSIAVTGVSAAEESVIDVENLDTVTSGAGWAYDAAIGIVTVTDDVTVTGKNENISLFVNAEDVVITLRNAELRNDNIPCGCSDMYYSYCDLICSASSGYAFTVKLEGENLMTVQDEEHSFYSEDKITVIGDGSLVINGGSEVFFTDLTVESGLVMINPTYADFENLDISGGRVVINSLAEANEVNISGGELDTNGCLWVRGDFNMTGGKYIGWSTDNHGGIDGIVTSLFVSEDLNIAAGCFYANEAPTESFIEGESIGYPAVVVAGDINYAYPVALVEGEWNTFESILGGVSGSGSGVSLRVEIGQGNIHICDNYYNIYVHENVAEYITVSTGAHAGDTVEIDVITPEGKTLKAVYYDDTEIEGESFIMPACEVLISAEYEAVEDNDSEQSSVQSSSEQSSFEQSSSAQSSSEQTSKSDSSSASQSKIEQSKNPNTNDMSFVFIGGIAVLAFAVAVITIKRKTKA